MATTTFTFQRPYELREIERDLLPRLIADREIFTVFPTENSDNTYLVWRQRDNFKGLQQLRGANGAPPRVMQLGGNEYIYRPGVYGEFEALDEVQLTERRNFSLATGQPVSLDDLVAEIQLQLLVRRLDRIELIVWNLLTTGTFSVATPGGAIIHTDSYTFQSFTASPTWGTFATATPLADLRTIQLKARGHSVRFDSSAQMFMNQLTVNNMLNNQNNNDLFGKRQGGFGTLNSLPQINQLLTGDNLPTITPYEGGYYDESATFHMFIPDTQGVLVGRRPGNTPVGEYRFTRNASNPGFAPGPYSVVIDHGPQKVPRDIEVHDGHNGGPVAFYPSAVVSCQL
jgi:hypothetical protein